MKFILAPFIVWVVSQTIKFIVRLLNHKTPSNLKGFFWTYVWAGGPPSTHAAILTSSLYLIWVAVGFSAIFNFCLAITLLWLYDMATDRKRQQLLNVYYTDGADNLKKIVSDGYMLDLAGHTVVEIGLGVILGIGMGILIAKI